MYQILCLHIYVGKFPKKMFSYISIHRFHIRKLLFVLIALVLHTLGTIFYSLQDFQYCCSTTVDVTFLLYLAKV